MAYGALARRYTKVTFGPRPWTSRRGPYERFFVRPGARALHGPAMGLPSRHARLFRRRFHGRDGSVVPGGRARRRARGCRAVQEDLSRRPRHARSIGCARQASGGGLAESGRSGSPRRHDDEVPLSVSNDRKRHSARSERSARDARPIDRTRTSSSSFDSTARSTSTPRTDIRAFPDLRSVFRRPTFASATSLVHAPPGAWQARSRSLAASGRAPEHATPISKTE